MVEPAAAAIETSAGTRLLLARCMLLLACVPSGGAVLAESYGIASLHDVFWFFAVPGYLILVGAWLVTWRSKHPTARPIADALAIGSVGGFLATIAYDLARMPFVLAGFRLFATNSTYGLWILDASMSSRFTEAAGWFYHFANGTTFGIMYALFMRGRHWAFGVAYAFLLETIAFVSPYGRIYHVVGNPLLMTIAYYGHFAYGLPLGFMVQHWDATIRYLRGIPMPIYGAAAVVLASAVVGPLYSPVERDVDARARAGVFAVDDDRLLPAWQRLPGPGQITIRNSCAGARTVVVDNVRTLPLAPCEEGILDLSVAGIHQLYIQKEGRTMSSYVLVDPVAAAP
jgi:hypothetical protein